MELQTARASDRPEGVRVDVLGQSPGKRGSTPHSVFDQIGTLSVRSRRLDSGLGLGLAEQDGLHWLGALPDQPLDLRPRLGEAVALTMVRPNRGDCRLPVKNCRDLWMVSWGRICCWKAGEGGCWGCDGAEARVAAVWRALGALGAGLTQAFGSSLAGDREDQLKSHVRPFIEQCGAALGFPVVAKTESRYAPVGGRPDPGNRPARGAGRSHRTERTGTWHELEPLPGTLLRAAEQLQESAQPDLCRRCRKGAVSHRSAGRGWALASSGRCGGRCGSSRSPGSRCCTPSWATGCAMAQAADNCRWTTSARPAGPRGIRANCWKCCG